MWQFLSSLPAWFWLGILILAGMTIIILAGSTAATALIAILKGGKVKVTKEGIEADADEKDIPSQ